MRGAMVVSDNDARVLEVRDVTKRFRGAPAPALDHVSLSVGRGRIYGLVGRNGAGKTTLMRIICGLSHPTSGAVSILGQEGEGGLCRARSHMGCLIEGPAVYAGLTAFENMAMRAYQKGCYDRAGIVRTLGAVGLAEAQGRRARDLSLGTRQRLGIAMALVGDPALLVLDEPTNGLDPVGMADMRRLLRLLCDQRGTTMLVSSHILSELYQMADRFVLMDKGRIVEERTHGELARTCGSGESAERYFVGRIMGGQARWA